MYLPHRPGVESYLGNARHHRPSTTPREGSRVAWPLEVHGVSSQFPPWPFSGEESYRKARLLKEAADAAVRFDEVFQTQHRRLNRSELQRAFNSYIWFLSFYRKSGGPLLPKCHFMIHLVQRARFKGNPKMYSTYRDESFNGLIAKIARSCHRRTWANAVHWKCHALHQKNHTKVINSNFFNKPKPEGKR